MTDLGVSTFVGVKSILLAHEDEVIFGYHVNELIWYATQKASDHCLRIRQ